MERKHLSRLIKKYRSLREKSQWDVAQALGYDTRQHISNVERNGSYSPIMVATISQFLRIPAEEVRDAFLKDKKNELEYEWLKIANIINKKKGEKYVPFEK